MKTIDYQNLSIAALDASERPLVDNVSFSVEPGEVLALIGESGAGKSTLGLAALGYVRGGCRIASGKVLLEGSDLFAMGRDALRRLRGRRVAYVAQSAASAFNPAMRIFDQIVEVSRVHGNLSREETVARAIDLARRMQLPTPEILFQRYPHQLSGGQLQRLMTLMALLPRPALLVLDEPTTALDVTTQLEVLSVLKRVIEEERVASLYISHDLAVVAQLANRIAVLRYGKLVELGTASQILSAAKDPYTRELLLAAKHAEASPSAQTAAEPEEPALLCVHDLSVSYGRAAEPALKGVSLTLRRGKCVAVLGESGSGKSTLAHAITGLTSRTAGDVLLAGQSLPTSYQRRSRDQLRRIQLVSQHPDLALNPNMTVSAILMRPLQLFYSQERARCRERVANLLELVELSPDLASRLPSQLSGGQRQRVNLARALAADPELIVCDEVTSALDTIVGAKVIALLADLQKRTGIAYLFITHDVAKAALVADEIIVMQRGAIVERGATASLLQNPQQDYTRTLLAAVPDLRDDWLAQRIAKEQQLSH